jgi:glycosyltransferase involved in cell wall biosynthesis
VPLQTPSLWPSTVAIVGNRDIAKFRGWFIRDLVTNGHCVVACAPDDAIVAETITSLGATFVPISIATTSINPWRDFRDIMRLQRVLRSFKADILLSHSTKANVIGPLAAQLAGVRKIFVIIDGLGYAFTEGPELKRALLRSVLLATFRLSIRFAAGVFVLNDSDRHFVSAAGLVSAKQRVVKINGTGIDLAEFPYSPPLECTIPRFLLIARLLMEKGIVEYVAAAQKLRVRFPHCRFQLLGAFGTNPGSLKRNQLAQWQAEGVIEYLGETPDVRPYLKACTVYVLPSYREGMPRTILEALATGRAVVTTDVPGCRDTVIHGVNGLVVPARDVGALAQAMQRFIDDPGLALKMGEAARKIAQERFDARVVNSIMMQTLALN